MTYQRRQRQSQLRWHAGAATALVATLATMAGSMAATASPASADGTPPTTGTAVAVTVPAWGNQLDRIKAEAAKLIAGRINSLNSEINVVKGKSFLGTDGVTLQTDMQADITGLEALGVKIESDTTVAEAIADSNLIFTQFRVYRLMLPVSGDVIGVDAATNKDVPNLGKEIAWLQGQEKSYNQGVLAPLVTNMQAQVQMATNATSGLSAQLLAYTPAEWNVNHGLLNGPGAQLRIADRAINAGRKDWDEGVNYLRHHHVPPTTTTTSTTTTSTTTTSTTTPSTTTTTVPATTTTSAGNLGAIQAWAARMISDRLASLQSAIKGVQGDSFLGPDGTQLVTEMNADISGLEALGAKIAADTTAAQARADANLIFSQFRVYDLVLSVVKDVTVVDEINNISVPNLDKSITNLQGQENSTNQAVLAPLVANMQLQGQTATSATSGLSVELLGYTAAQWDANHHLLAGATANIYVAQRALATAAKDRSKAEHYLHSLHGHRHH